MEPTWFPLEPSWRVPHPEFEQWAQIGILVYLIVSAIIIFAIDWRNGRKN